MEWSLFRLFCFYKIIISILRKERTILASKHGLISLQVSAFRPKTQSQPPSSFPQPRSSILKCAQSSWRVYFSSGATWKKKVNRKHMGMVCERSVCLCLKKILQEEYVRLAKCLGCLKSGLWPLALDWRHLIGTKSSCCCSLSGILAIRKIKKITWIILMVRRVRKSKRSFFHLWGVGGDGGGGVGCRPG